MTSHRRQPQRTPNGTHPHLQSLRAGLHPDALYILGSTFVGLTLIGLALHRYVIEPQQFDTTTDVIVHVGIGVVVLIFAFERYFRNLDAWHDYLIDVERRNASQLTGATFIDCTVGGGDDDRPDDGHLVCADCGFPIIPGEPVVAATRGDDRSDHFHSRCFAGVHRAE